jgi:nitroimidazol reductase NimA-like FMN-containing flavoprotein (pyridoxamine 5'-phosphate oxidase superfamily)
VTAAVSPRSQVKRQPDRAGYEPDAIHAVLDAVPVGHVGIVVDGRPIVIPMLYGRDPAAATTTLYLHGSVASRLARSLATGVDVCLTATIVDGLVLARSAFHHSMNYRSAVVYGRAVTVDADEQLHGLRCISEHLAPGRWAVVREPSPAELKITKVLRLVVEEGSMKARTGGPIDDPDDLAHPVWAGVLPCTTAWGTPIDADDLDPAFATTPVPNATQ